MSMKMVLHFKAKHFIIVWIGGNTILLVINVVSVVLHKIHKSNDDVAHTNRAMDNSNNKTSATNGQMSNREWTRDIA